MSNSRYRSMSDVAMRHRGTFLGIKEAARDHITPVMVMECQGSVSNIEFVVRNRQGNTQTVSYDDPNLIILLPEICMVNAACEETGKGFASWCEASAARQLRRSLTMEIVQNHPIGRVDFPNQMISHVSKWDKAESFFNHSFPSFSEALGFLNNNEAFSAAFSSKFAVGFCSTLGIALFYRDCKVGHIQDGQPILIEHYNYLQEQLEEVTHAA